jgi:hypothetical protein
MSNETYFNSSRDLLKAYKDGFIGSWCDPEDIDKLLGELPHPLFGAAAHDLAGTGKGKVALLYKNVWKFDPGFGPAERQTTGDCQNGSDLVRMADGSLKMIKDIKTGEYVISANGNKRKVLNTIKKSYNGKMVQIKVDGYHQIISSTPDHRYIVDPINMEYKAIAALEIGDSVYLPSINHEESKSNSNALYSGRMVKIKDIQIVEPEDQFVYCIEVDTDHNFICNGYGISNCVSHATRNAVDVTRACEIIGGQKEDFVTRSATEGIYGSRGHGGQGMSCSVAARFVHQNGGILLRKKYDSIDLSVYNSSTGTRWGSRGIPPEVITEAKKHQVKTISLVNTIEQARDAIANGYALSVCSGAGFSSRRDQHGIASRSGGWSHAMAWVATDDSHEIYKETLFLVQNSWGNWNSGPKRFDQPDGSFWIRESVAASMLSGNGSWAFSDVDGFPPRKVIWTLDTEF